MIEVDNPVKVQEFFLAEPLGNLTPILTPTKMQIVRFTDTVAAVLTHCTSKLRLLGGQNYLVLTETKYKLQVNKQDRAIPIRPIEPAPYDNSKHNRKTW